MPPLQWVARVGKPQVAFLENPIIMAETYVIDVQLRTVFGKKCGALRRQGIVPGVVYGPKIDPVHIQVAYRPLQVILMRAGGTHLINLTADGNSYPVLAREVQRDVIKGDILHVDFLAVDLLSKIRTEIPVHFINESPAVTGRLGNLVNGASTIEIEALPADLPERVDVDLSGLVNINDSIHVRDLNLGDTIDIVSDPDEMIVRITALVAEEEEVVEEAAEEEVSAEPEVIGRGKKDEEEDDEV
jgi:large subunit ribosomal protein L25